MFEMHKLKCIINYHFPTVLGLSIFLTTCMSSIWVHCRHTDVKACILFIYQTKVLNEVRLDKIREHIT